LEWTVAGFGDFSGNANETDMLLRNSNTGQFNVYDISHNALTSAASIGTVGLEWTVAGFGDFSGNVRHSSHMWIIDEALAKMNAELPIDLPKARASGKAA